MAEGVDINLLDLIISNGIRTQLLALTVLDWLCRTNWSSDQKTTVFAYNARCCWGCRAPSLRLSILLLCRSTYYLYAVRNVVLIQNSFEASRTRGSLTVWRWSSSSLTLCVTKWFGRFLRSVSVTDQSCVFICNHRFPIFSWLRDRGSDRRSLYAIRWVFLRNILLLRGANAYRFRLPISSRIEGVEMRISLAWGIDFGADKER